METKVSNIAILIAFLIIITICSMFTFSNTYKHIYNEFCSLDSSNITNKFADIQDYYRDNFFIRDKFIDCFGVVQKLLNKDMVGDMEFIKDKNHVIQAFDLSYNYENFINQMIILKKETDKRNTPLLYVQIPSRVIRNYTQVEDGFINNQNKNLDILVDGLQNNNIDVIDYRKYIGNDKDKYKPSDVFFKTDAHLTTEAELDILKIITSKLEQSYSIKFNNKSYVLDMNNYYLDSRKFLGNYARSVGRYFVGLDDFNMYTPKFYTHMALVDKENNTIREGNFDSTLTNMYQNNKSSNELTYWVTNYGQFTTDCYSYRNYNVEENNILLIMDSMGYRMASYLALMSKNITIIDPRFDINSKSLWKQINNNSFDAIIVLQCNQLVGCKFNREVLNNPQAEIVSQNTPTIINNKDSYNINITVKNTGYESWNEDKQVRLCIWQDGIDYGYRIYLPDDVEVKPGEEYTFVLSNFVAPPRDTTYVEFQMLQEGITYFGEKERVDITIKK